MPDLDLTADKKGSDGLTLPVDGSVDRVDKRLSTVSTVSTGAVDSENPHKYRAKRYLSTMSTIFS